MHRLLYSRKIKLPDRNTLGPNKVQKRLQVLLEERQEARKRLRRAIQNGFKSSVSDSHKLDVIVEVEIDLNEYRNELMDIDDDGDHEDHEDQSFGRVKNMKF